MVHVYFIPGGAEVYVEAMSSIISLRNSRPESPAYCSLHSQTKVGQIMPWKRPRRAFLQPFAYTIPISRKQNVGQKKACTTIFKASAFANHNLGCLLGSNCRWVSSNLLRKVVEYESQKIVLLKILYFNRNGKKNIFKVLKMEDFSLDCR